MDIKLLKVLDAREERWIRRRMIVQKNKRCLITVTLCVPFNYRTSDEFYEIFLNLCREFWDILIYKGYKVYSEGYMRNEDGPAFFVSTEDNAFKIKKICAETEDTITGGRMLDIDVMDSEGNPISRSDIGLPPRKCFVCNKPASVCVSRKLHSSDEISAVVEQLKKQVNIV